MKRQYYPDRLIRQAASEIIKENEKALIQSLKNAENETAEKIARIIFLSEQLAVNKMLIKLEIIEITE